MSSTPFIIGLSGVEELHLQTTKLTELPECVLELKNTTGRGFRGLLKLTPRHYRGDVTQKGAFTLSHLFLELLL